MGLELTKGLSLESRISKADHSQGGMLAVCRDTGDSWEHGRKECRASKDRGLGNHHGWGEKMNTE